MLIDRSETATNPARHAHFFHRQSESFHFAIYWSTRSKTSLCSLCNLCNLINRRATVQKVDPKCGWRNSKCSGGNKERRYVPAPSTNIVRNGIKMSRFLKTRWSLLLLGVSFHSPPALHSTNQARASHATKGGASTTQRIHSRIGEHSTQHSAQSIKLVQLHYPSFPNEDCSQVADTCLWVLGGVHTREKLELPFSAVPNYLQWNCYFVQDNTLMEFQIAETFGPSMNVSLQWKSSTGVLQAPRAFFLHGKDFSDMVPCSVCNQCAAEMFWSARIWEWQPGISLIDDQNPHLSQTGTMNEFLHSKPWNLIRFAQTRIDVLEKQKVNCTW